MTVGIGFTNGIEAVVITDSRVSSRVSGSGRQSDSVDKMGTFSTEKYSGVIYGTGSANVLLGTIKLLKDFSKSNNLDSFTEEVFKEYKIRIDEYDTQVLESSVNEIRKKSKLIEKEEERNQFERKGIHEIIEDYDKNKSLMNTPMTIVSYDNEKKKIRVFEVNQVFKAEVFSAHGEIGAGRDGANLYLSAKLQGKNIDKLSLSEMIFFTLNAYSFSTVNQGVGGTPKIAIISEKGYNILEPEKTIALTNLSGAYLSEVSPSEIDNSSTKKIIEYILNNDKPNYISFAQKIGINEDTFKNIYIPYSSWQERANRKV
jgi:hypothetical protein